MAEDERRYDSTAVCAAAGLPRKTLEAWLLRRLLPLPPGPGTGRARRYSLLDVVRIVAAADLTRLGIGIGVVSRAVASIEHRHIDDPFHFAARPEDGPMVLILASSPGELRRQEGEEAPATMTTSKAGIEHALDYRFLGGRPASYTVLDISAIIARTRAVLDGHQAATEVA